MQGAMLLDERFTFVRKKVLKALLDLLLQKVIFLHTSTNF